MFASLLLNNCGIKVPNIRVCKAAGRIIYGADCIPILAKDKSEFTYMGYQETLNFLSAMPDMADATNSQKTINGHPPAVFMSGEDWVRFETTLEQACEKLGCTMEVTTAIKQVEANVDGLKSK